MVTYITKQGTATKIRLVSANITKEYLISKPANLVSKNNVLKIIFNSEGSNNKLDVITIDYSTINDKLGSSDLTGYLSAALALDYFTN